MKCVYDIEFFGDLVPFLEDDNITDINWNGKHLLINDISKGKYFAQTILDDNFVDKFTRRIANMVKLSFNQYSPILEAEMKDKNLRIECVHDSVSSTGVIISLRKTFDFNRIDTKQSLENGYFVEEILQILQNAVLNNFNITICGKPGAGKTELLKFLTGFIPKNAFVTTIEDVLEIHYPQLHPGRYCAELKISPQFSYSDAIKTAVRLMTNWLILSEARGPEVRFLVTGMSSGTHSISTVHAEGVRGIPERFKEMYESDGSDKEKLDRIFKQIQVGIKVESFESGTIDRKITELALFDSAGGKNETYVIYNHGVWNKEIIPDIYKCLFEREVQHSEKKREGKAKKR